MTTSSPTTEEVAPNAEEVIAASLAEGTDGILVGLLADLQAEPIRLSPGALQERVRSLRGLPFEQVRAGIQQILSELELYRAGYDAGYEAGFAARLNSATMDLDEVRDELQVLVEALDRITEKAAQLVAEGKS